MSGSRDRAYYKAIRRVTASVSANDKELHELLDVIIRNTARPMSAAASLLLLDSEGKKLVHVSSWGLPKAFILKGILDPAQSLQEILSGEPVTVSDVTEDDNIQYPEVVKKAGIKSVLAVPIQLEGKPAGSIRVYTREPFQFSNQDISFVSTMSNLTSLTLSNHILRDAALQRQHGKYDSEMDTSLLQHARSTAFAHPSEKEFSQILDFYNIEWVYEPHSFPLTWEGGTVTEMFTPDFYLPGFDLYIELTTMKQSLVTAKNRKVRRLQELNPSINIALLYRKDFERLLAKFGCGPLAESRGQGVSRVLYSSAEIQERVNELALQLSEDFSGSRPVMVGVLRGVFCFMADLIRQMTIPVGVDFMTISYYGGINDSRVTITKDINLPVEGRPLILVEDIVDTGLTLNYIIKHIRAKNVSEFAVCALFDKRARRIIDVPLRYTGFQIPDEFIVGYGLDYLEEYRNLPFVGVLENDGGIL